MSKTRVFMDTNVILEANRTGHWKTICHHYSVETVEKCVEEVLTGNPDAKYRTNVHLKTLTDGLTERHKISKRDIAEFILTYPDCLGLDDGEQQLFALIYAKKILQNALVVITTADKAAIRAAGKLGWIDSLKSFEELLLKCGIQKSQMENLRPHFRTIWLSNVKTQYFWILSKLALCSITLK